MLVDDTCFEVNNGNKQVNSENQDKKSDLETNHDNLFLCRVEKSIKRWLRDSIIIIMRIIVV